MSVKGTLEKIGGGETDESLLIIRMEKKRKSEETSFRTEAIQSLE